MGSNMASELGTMVFVDEVKTRAKIKELIQGFYNKEDLRKLFDHPNMRYRVDVSDNREDFRQLFVPPINDEQLGHTFFLNVISLTGNLIRGLIADGDDNLHTYCTYSLDEFQ